MADVMMAITFQDALCTSRDSFDDCFDTEEVLDASNEQLLSVAFESGEADLWLCTPPTSPPLSAQHFPTFADPLMTCAAASALWTEQLAVEPAHTSASSASASSASSQLTPPCSPRASDEMHDSQLKLNMLDDCSVSMSLLESSEFMLSDAHSTLADAAGLAPFPRIRKPLVGARKARSGSPELMLETMGDDALSKRLTHNAVLERKRRHDLKHCYKVLRNQIPDLQDNERAPTGHILMRACEYINGLKAKEQQLVEAIAAARAENERLRRALR